MSPDLHSVLYKVLKYADECLKADVEPSIDEARKLAGVGNIFFTQAMAEADRKQLLTGLYFPDNIDSREPRVFANHMAITLDGEEYLKDNSSMKKVASMMGSAVAAAIDSAVNATIKASLGF